MLKQPIPVDEMIHGDKFAAIADVEINMSANGTKTMRGIDLLTDGMPHIVFCKTDFLDVFFEMIKEIDSPRFVLITHNSDFPITEERWNKAPRCIHSWYALNVAYAVRGLIQIPSGMERPAGGGYSSDMSKIETAWSIPIPERLGNIYGCMNVNTNPVERHPVRELFKGRLGVTWRGYGASHQEFLDGCRNHRFVLSPPGNGIDCHRTWEALYCGAIPIVKRSEHTDGFFDLPILIVEDWSILTDAVLQIVWDEFSRREFDYKKAKMSFWSKLVRDTVRTLG